MKLTRPVKILLIGILFDMSLTLWGTYHKGILAEQNPYIQAILHNGPITLIAFTVFYFIALIKIAQWVGPRYGSYLLYSIGLVHIFYAFSWLTLWEIYVHIEIITAGVFLSSIALALIVALILIKSLPKVFPVRSIG